MKYIKESNIEEIYVNGVREEGEEYSYTKDSLENVNKKTNNEHDKIFRKILDIKSETANFINDMLKPKKEIKAEDIEKYNSSFISKDLVNQECDVIYKLKEKDIFFLIEQQTKIDYTILSKIMLLEKYKGKDLTECLDKVMNEIDNNKEDYNSEGKEVLIILIEKILNRKIGEERAKEIIKKLKGDDLKMLNVLESVDRENKAIYNNGMKAGIKFGIKTGIKAGIEKTIQEMLKMKMPINQISKITHYTEEKIKKIQNSNTNK